MHAYDFVVKDFVIKSGIIWARPCILTVLCHFKKLFYLFICRERGRDGERERDRERNIKVWEIHQSVASHTPSPGYLAHNPGICPDWESSQWPFGSQACTQSTEPHQPRLSATFDFIHSIHDILIHGMFQILISVSCLVGFGDMSYIYNITENVIISSSCFLLLL